MRRLACAAAIGMLGCETPPPASGVGEAPSPLGAEAAQYAILTTLSFAGATADGVAEGFDIDGVESDGTEVETCAQADYTSPQGTPGIDNAFAGLLPGLRATEVGAVEGLVQAAINDGELLALLMLEGLPPGRKDGEVALTVHTAVGAPLLGTHGLLLADQTFAIAPDSPASRFEGASVTEGVVLAGPFGVTVPLVVFGKTYRLSLQDGWIRFHVAEDGTVTQGVLGGAVPVSEIRKMVEIAAIDAGEGVIDLVMPVVEAFADLDPDATGACTRITVTVVFEAVNAYVYPDEPGQAGASSAARRP